MSTVYWTLNSQWQRVTAGTLIGRGGEGSVYLSPEHPGMVLKIYASQPDPRKIQKLRAMVALADRELLQWTAWPVHLVADADGNAVGFLMKQLVGQRDIHELYTVKSRCNYFPEADFRFILRACGNLARLFGMLHSKGIVVGDVNHGNFKIGSDGISHLIDCDSVQLRAGNELYTCDVGSPLFLAPELHAQQSLKGLVRTEQHDLFALAVLLFHLLFLGRHPFSGRPLTNEDLTIEKAIAEYRFPYSPDARRMGVEQPRGTVPLAMVGPELSGLFLRAFCKYGAVAQRPTAIEWMTAIDRLETQLEKCNKARWHTFPKAYGQCPWCVVEAAFSSRLFGQPLDQSARHKIAALWKRAVGIDAPTDPPPLPSELPWVCPADADVPDQFLKLIRRCAAIAVLVIGVTFPFWLQTSELWVAFPTAVAVAALIWPFPPFPRRMQALKEIKLANDDWRRLTRAWNERATAERFVRLKTELDQLRTELIELPKQRRLAHQEHKRSSAKLDLERHLDRSRINDRIPNIGPSRIATLRSWGIETAADIDPDVLFAVSGIGPVCITSLMQWRAKLETDFMNSISGRVYRAGADAIDDQMNQHEEALVTTLEIKVEELAAVRNSIQNARAELLPQLRETWDRINIARLNAALY